MNDDAEGSERSGPDPQDRPDPAQSGAPEHAGERPPPPDTDPARDNPAEPAPPGGYICDICGAPMWERHCKILCPVCGYQRDCSDP